MPYHQITEDQRYQIAVMRGGRASVAAIVRALGRRRSSILRELGRPIRARPRVVGGRRQVGHWEIDTLQGTGRGACALSAVERKTGYLVLGKLARATGAAFAARAIALFRRQPHRVRTVTADNGSEMTAAPVIEAGLGARFYFATPYHAWQRGTNENTNGLVRQYLPKRQSMAHLTQWDLHRIARHLNRRPRKASRRSHPGGMR